MTLLDDLQQAKAETTIDAGCKLCEFINEQQDDETREALSEASAGRIGRDKLLAVLAKYNTGIGHRTVRRHRQEGHTP